MKRYLIVPLAGILLLVQPMLEAQASDKRTRDAALIGGGVGLITNGISGAAKGAALGAGAGALTNKNKGSKTKKDATTGAAIGAGVGLLTKGSVKGVAKGALYGGAAGAVVGEQRDKKKK